MLKLLRINNIALVPALELEFGAGLTLLTGETGAGKSILIDALSLVLGERSDTGLRDDADVLQPWLAAHWDQAPATTSAPTATPVPAAAPTERDGTNNGGPDHDNRHTWHRNGREEQ